MGRWEGRCFCLEERYIQCKGEESFLRDSDRGRGGREGEKERERGDRGSGRKEKG